MRPQEQDIARLLKKSLPSAQQEEAVGKRVFYRLLLARAENPAASMPNEDEDDSHWTSRRRLSIALALTAAAASVFIFLVLTSGLWRTAEKIANTESVVASDSDGRMLVLPDGSQVEMRSHSEFRIVQADDGLHVRLNAGSVIVTAAKQKTRQHLYVDTKDAIVSVVGTIFLVSVEQTGSRAGVIEGVVNVQHGAISQQLLPGQQVATNPTMEAVPLEVQASWSRYAATYLAMLQQLALQQRSAIAAPPAAPPQSQPAPARQNAPAGDSLTITGAPISGGAARLGQRSEQAELEMEQALISREPVADLFFRIEANYFQLNRAEYFVPVTLKIPGTELTGSQNAKRVAFDIVATVTDDLGTHIANLRDAIDVPWSEEAAKELATRQITYETAFTLLAGKYSVKFLVRNGITGRIGTYETSLLIPNLSREGKNIPISSVVLGGELVNSGAAPSNSTQRGAVNPLMIEGKKLIPSVNRMFSKARDLIVFLQAYEPNVTAIAPLTAFATIYRGQTKVFETPPLIVKDDVGRALKTLPIKLTVPLSSLPVGEYECQVTVLDPATQKSTVWRSPINVVN